MLIDKVELTMNHIGLGELTELATMTLFGNTHSHDITRGTGGSISDIVDVSGAHLYPGYYWTHLRVPPNRLLGDFKVWDTINVGVDVRTFGGLLLNSTYVLGREGELQADSTQWNLDALPSMRAANTFYVDGIEGEPKPSAPKAGTVAELPKQKETPASLSLFRQVRDRANIDPHFDGKLTTSQPLQYQLILGRDLQPGHGIVFSRYVEISDVLERELLSQHVWPPFSEALLGYLSVIERETYYFSNVRRPHLLRANIRAKLSKPTSAQQATKKDVVAAGVLTSVIEMYSDHGALLVMAKAQKLIAIPRDQQALLAQADMLLARHGQNEAAKIAEEQK